MALRDAASRIPPVKDWLPTTLMGRLKLAAYGVVGIVAVVLVLHFLLQSGGLSDSSNCTDFLRATRTEQQQYVDGWADKSVFDIYGPEFISMCRDARQTGGPDTLGAVGQAILNGHGTSQ